MQAADRLAVKIERFIVQHGRGTPACDAAINTELDVQEVLTAALLPANSVVYRTIVGAWLRDRARKNEELRKQKETMREEQMVPVEVAAGGKCKITVWMTPAQAAKERGSR